jgi:zinc/manganese transport system substrate-binding protein
MNRVGLLCVLALGLFWPDSFAAEKKLRVLTTFLPGYCFASSVAGDRAEVENLLAANVSLHDYQLSPADLRKISQADLIVLNGLGMETFLDRALRNVAGDTGSKLVRLSDGLERQLMESGRAHRAEPGHDHSRDPHIWLDPILASHCVTNVLGALQKADPKNAEYYEANARRYQEALRRLHEDLLKELEPAKGVAFITYHDAFRYFVRRYGLKLAGVVERVPEIPPSAREMGELHQVIREQKVKALFSEPGGGAPLARQIAKDAGIGLAELDPLETGALNRDSYEKGMRKNAAALVKALR